MIMAATVDYVGKEGLSINWTDVAKFMASATVNSEGPKCVRPGSHCIFCDILQLGEGSANQIPTTDAGADVAVACASVTSLPLSASRRVVTMPNIKITRKGNAGEAGKVCGCVRRRLRRPRKLI